MQPRLPIPQCVGRRFHQGCSAERARLPVQWNQDAGVDASIATSEFERTDVADVTDASAGVMSA
jgi:hypothetical protein